MSSRVNAYAHNTYEDFSGTSSAAHDNPYDGLIISSENDAKQIQERYNTHRLGRNEQQKAKIQAPDFPGINIDPVLQRLVDQTIEPGFKDERYCFVFWARPPRKVKHLIQEIQARLLTVAPNLWLMPIDCLHMTTLEVTHSRTKEKIEELVATMRPNIPSITDYPYEHRARLIKPLVGYDAAACALTFVPAAGEALTRGRTLDDDQYTYHHLRRDVYSLCEKTSVEVDSRYTVPSAHLTIGRFINPKDFTQPDGTQSMAKVIAKIEEINDWLCREYWPKPDDSTINDGGEWVVGEEQGFDCRKGTLWYGGGETVWLGKGF